MNSPSNHPRWRTAFWYLRPSRRQLCSRVLRFCFCSWGTPRPPPRRRSDETGPAFRNVARRIRYASSKLCGPCRTDIFQPVLLDRNGTLYDFGGCCHICCEPALRPGCRTKTMAGIMVFGNAPTTIAFVIPEWFLTHAVPHLCSGSHSHHKFGLSCRGFSRSSI